MTDILRLLGERIERAKRPLFLNHARADGDSLGSNLALYLRAKAANQSPTIFAPEEKNPKYNFLPCFDDILVNADAVDFSRHDLIVCADVADGKLTGFSDALSSRRDDLLVIDHHASAQPFGAVEYLDPTASSTAEMLVRLFRARKWAVTPDIATCLVTGLLADTGVLRFPLTTPATLRTAADLLEQGASYHTVIQKMYETLPLPAIRLWARAMATLTIDSKIRMASALVTQNDFSDTGATRAMAEGLPNFLNQLEGVRGVVLFEELPDGVKGSLRAREDDVNVAAVAEHFGGGGHKRAAGFYAQESLKEVLARWKTLCDSGTV